MIKLVRPEVQHEHKYREMIAEWKEYGGPFVPCIIDYDCKNEIDYEATLKVIEDYNKGNIFDYDIDYFERSDFLFLMEGDKLVGMGEVRHNLKPLGVATLGHIACGIRPSCRGKGYGREAVEAMIEKLKEDNIEEVVVCHYRENEITPKMIKSLGFEYRNSTISEVSKKEIKCHIKKLKG